MQYTVQLAADLEAELDRIKAARPHLAARVDRAGNILVTHLACPRQRIIRVRVGADGKQHALVKGSGGAVYRVGADWSCSCPDYYYRGKGCKHSIAVWALHRVGRKPARRKHRVSKPRRDSLRGVQADPERLSAIADKLGV